MFSLWENYSKCFIHGNLFLQKTSKTSVCEAVLVSIAFLMSIVNAVETEVWLPTQVWVLTLGFVLMLQVRAQLVQQQQQAAAAVQAAQAQAAQMGASGQVRAQGPLSQLTALGQVHEMSMELGFWWFLVRALTLVTPCIKGIWSSLLFLLCLESEAGFHCQPLCACSLSQVGPSVACTDTGVHMSKVVFCGHTTSLTVLVPGVYHLFFQ